MPDPTKPIRNDSFPDPKALFSVSDLLQLMRTRSVAEVRIGLEFLQKKNPAQYRAFCSFYQSL